MSQKNKKIKKETKEDKHSAYMPIWKKISFPLIISLAFFTVSESLLRIFNFPSEESFQFKFLVREMDNDVEYPFMQYDDLLFWRPKPLSKAIFKEKEIYINTMGMRDVERNQKKEEGVLRILCFGDSATFGYGVSLEDTYPKQLERLLAKQFPYKKIEVFNMGVTGYSSFQGLNYLKSQRIHLNPDIVLFSFGPNDSLKRFYLSDKELFERNNIAAGLRRRLRRSNIYNLLRVIIYKIKNVSINKNKKVFRVTPEEYRDNMRAAVNLAKKHNISLIFMATPHAKPAYTTFKLFAKQYRRALKEIAGRYEIPLVEISKLTENYQGTSNQIYFLDPVHPNAMGNEIIAKEIFKTLEKHGKIEKGKHISGKPAKVVQDNANKYNELGISLARQGKLDDAINNFSEALRINPNFTDTRNNLGFALAEQGKTREAIKHYLEAIRIDPGYARAYYNLGSAWLSLGDHKKSFEYFTQAYNIYRKKFGENSPSAKDTMKQIERLKEKIKTEK